MSILKTVGYTVLAFFGIGVILGIGAILSAIGAVVGTIALGGFALLIIVLVVKEYFDKSP